MIYIKDRFLRYPPSVLQIMTIFGPVVFLKFFRDYLTSWSKRIFLQTKDCKDFESFAIRVVGRSLYETFYKPYAIKLWGLPPTTISYEPIINRLRRFEAKQFIRELMLSVSGKKASPVYYYPPHGIGQIAEALKERFLKNGGNLLLSTEIESLIVQDNMITQVNLLDQNRKKLCLCPESFVSTVPLDITLRWINRSSSTAGHAAFPLRWRGLRLLFIHIDRPLTHENETFYVPEPPFSVGRISEISKYSPQIQTPGFKGSLLTIEVPCSPGDEIWETGHDQFLAKSLSELSQLKILQEPTILGSFSKRISNVYPIQESDWKEKFLAAYNQTNHASNLYLIGRAALFLHCNIDHAMTMGLRLASHLTDPSQTRDAWEETVKSFFSFKVRD